MGVSSQDHTYLLMTGGHKIFVKFYMVALMAWQAAEGIPTNLNNLTHTVDFVWQNCI